MNARFFAFAGIAAALSAAPAFAQLTDAYESGILHTALGGATLGPVDARRLPVHNLGSSGQDGVDIQLRCTAGGGSGVQIPFGNPPGAAIRIRPRGWDGTIKGRVDMVVNSDGSVTSTVDYSGIGATSMRTCTYDSSGHLLTDQTTPGPIVDFLDNPQCPPPLVPTLWYTHSGQVVWGCGYGLNDYGNPYPYLRTVSPGLPPGEPYPSDLNDLLVTGKGLPQFTVVDASLGEFGVDTWAVGQAQVIPGDPNQGQSPPIKINNIGSSGQDGVAIDLGPDTGTWSLRSKKCPDCPPGHVTLIKFYDDGARVVNQASTMADGASGGETLQVDFNLNTTDMDVEYLDPNNYVLARYPVGGLSFGGWMSGMCAPGCAEIWEQNWYSGSWTFIRCDCLSSYDFYTNTGIGITGVHSIRFIPHGTDNPVIRDAVMTSDDSSRTLEIDDVSTSVKCPGDLTGDRAVDLSDLAIALSAYGHPSGVADLDGDGVVGLPDIAILLSDYGKTCP